LVLQLRTEHTTEPPPCPDSRNKTPPGTVSADIARYRSKKCSSIEQFFSPARISAAKIHSLASISGGPFDAHDGNLPMNL
jgi:hypothetical protein